MPTKSFVFVISFWLSLFVCAIMAVAGPILNGQPITAAGFVGALIATTVVGTIVSFVLPVAKWGAMFARAHGAQHGSVADRLLSAVIPATVILLVLAFELVALQTGFGDLGGFGFVDRWLGAVIEFWPIVWLSIVLVQPACEWLTLKMVKKPFVEMATEAA